MVAGGQTRQIQLLQKALLMEGEIVVINTSQFESVDKCKFVNQYHIKKQIQDPDNKNKSTMVELFNSCAQIQVTLFLRDLYYEKKGLEIPHDNPVWEEAKARWLEEHG